MENNTNKVKGYKVFNSDWSCTPIAGVKKQYTCPGKFEEEIDLDICRKGMHFCKRATDCFNYKSFDPNNKVAEVIAYGKVIEKGDKCCTDKLKIVREIPWNELLDIVNTGKACAGLGNSGNWNSGNCNSGDWNSGCFNTKEQKIYLFNKPSDWTIIDWRGSKARIILNCMPRKNLRYILFSEMTDGEKSEHHEAEVTGGYLKEEDNTNVRQSWWDELSADEKDTVKAIPNFDRAIFKEITGIDVGE